MDFGVLAGNKHFNSRIYEMLEELDPLDAAAVARKFKTERNEQRFHTFRELIVGSHLRKQGLNLRYERNILGKSPDWVETAPDGEVAEIFDVVTLHQRKEIENDILATLSTGRIWSGWVTIPPDHIYTKVEQKADAYSAMVATVRKPYVVCLFGEFAACVDADEVSHVLHEHHGGIFSKSPALAGVIYFCEESGSYTFSHYANPWASFPSSYVLQHSRAA